MSTPIKNFDINTTKSHQESKAYWGPNESDIITNKLLIENPLKSLINIKKRVRQLPTNGKVENTLQRQAIVKMIESYDNGFIVEETQILNAITQITKELFSTYKIYDDKPVVLFIFEDPYYVYERFICNNIKE